MAQLLAVLRFTGSVEPGHLVVERLAALAPNMPGEAVDCLELMIQGDAEGWGILGWQDDAKAILSTALGIPDSPAHHRAEAVINYLASIGHLEYRDLLSP